MNSQENYTEETEEATAVAERDPEDANGDSLVSEESALDYRNRWETIQTDFIDEPRRSVEEADRLVSEVIEEMARTFQEQRSSLEARWADDEGVSTEDLRVALRLYRTFFERLLSA